MYKEILNEKQLNLLPLVEHFVKKGFFLAGGTALALQLGHRESIDLDIFSNKNFENSDILKEIRKVTGEDKDLRVVIDKLDEYTLFVDNVKITFLNYPFAIKDFDESIGIKLATPLAIGAMKAYALGRRGKWKDYVDLYILLQQLPLSDIVEKTKEIFGSVFSERMFIQQLCYFEDIDFTEQVVWRIPNPPSEEEIKEFLRKTTTQI